MYTSKPFTNAMRTLRAPRIFKRGITDYVTFPALGSGSETSGRNKGQFKIHMLKAPSHLGHYTYRMNRMYNEDRYAVSILKLPIKYEEYGMSKDVMHNCFVASVFDGHGGDDCANFLQHHLHSRVELWQGSDEQSFMGLLEKYYKDIGGYWKRVYRKRAEIFKDLEPTSKEIDDLRLRLYQTYLQVDYDFMTEHDRSGSTSTSVFMYNLDVLDEQEMYFSPGTVSRLHVAQVGDTKCILCDRNGQSHALNSIHHPSSPAESRRLNKFTAGFATDSFGENRFMNFANTRAFGDLIAKSKGISAEPDITSYIIGDATAIARAELGHETPGSVGGDECFLVLVSDGVTGYATDQEICDLVMSTHNEHNGTPQRCAEEVVKYVDAIGGDDNATCIVIKLSNWGGWPAQDRTKRLREDKLKEGISKMDMDRYG